MLAGARVFGLTPDAIMYTTAMSACEKGRRWDCALELFATMECQLTMPTLLACNIAMSAYRETACWNSALRLLRRMRSLRIEPSDSTYRAAVTACTSAGHYQEANELVRATLKHGVSKIASKP